MNVHTIGDVAKFFEFDVASCVEFPNRERRNLRLEVLCEVPTSFYVQLGPKDMRFLARVEGHHEINFIAPGPVAVYATPDDEESAVMWWSPEVETYAVVIPDAETFVTITERKARNPELEHMMGKVMANMERRFADLEYSLEAARQAEAEAIARAERLAAAAEKKNGKKRSPKAAPANAVAGSADEGAASDAGASGSDEGGGDDAGTGDE